MSSAYHPISNSRAELAVKCTKRLLMENVGLNGKLQNDKMVLTQRNTPDLGCRLSAAQTLLGCRGYRGEVLLDFYKLILFNIFLS